MKILFIEPCFVNFGGYFRAFNICSSLAKKRVHVDLLCAAENRFQFSTKKTVYNQYFTCYELPRFQYHFFLNGRILRGILAFFYGLFGNYDIIHAAVPVQLESNIPAFLLKMIGKKVVMDWDDYWEGSSIYGEYKIMKQYVAFCEHHAPRFFKDMIVVSNFLKEMALKRGATHVLKLINGVNEDQFTTHTRSESRKKLGLKSTGKYLLTFGNTYINDRARLLFKVFEEILAKDSTVKLLFNMDPRHVIKEQNLESEIDKKILKNIVTVGQIPQKNLGYYLAASDAVIFLMGDADNERACFPIRIGSYLNGEAVIILNDVNSEASNTLKPLKCAIIEKDMRKLAEKTIEFLNDSSMQKKLHNNAKRAKETLSWDTLIESLIDFYSHV